LAILFDQTESLDKILISNIPSKFLDEIDDFLIEAELENRDYVDASDYAIAIMQLNNYTMADLHQVLSHKDCLLRIKNQGHYRDLDIHINLMNELRNFY